MTETSAAAGAYLRELSAKRPAYPLEARSKYIPSLDGLRAVSILIVIASHVGLHNLVPGGFGVTVFFFISGFLITRLMFAEVERSGRLSLPRFYTRRFLRLAPALLLMILVTGLLISPWLDSVPWQEILASIFYYANYYIYYHPDLHLPIRALWSLAIEEHYYLAYPFLFALLVRKPGRLLVLLVGLCIAALVWRVILIYGLGVPSDMPDPAMPYTYLATDCRVDSILFGAILSVLCQMPRGQALIRRLANWPTFLAATAVLLASFAARDSEFRETLRYSIQSAALFVLVASCLFGVQFGLFRKILEVGPMLWIGKISYSLYVWHLAVVSLMKWHFAGGATWQWALASLPLIVAVAALSYYGVERPVAAVRARLH